MNTEAVMTRYRELGSTPEASVQARTESQERGQQHWHRLYERCWCGYLTVPARYYTYDEKGIQTNTQAQAESAYLKEMSVIVPQAVKHEVVKQAMLNSCECGNEIKGRGKKCPACYQRAYRERSK